jgi:hypothetical protein
LFSILFSLALREKGAVFSLILLCFEMSALLRGACAGTRGAAPAGPSGRQSQRHRPRLAAAAAAFDNDDDATPSPRRQNNPRSSTPPSPEQKLAKFRVRRVSKRDHGKRSKGPKEKV